MIRFRLKERIADREFALGRRITLDDISQATGIHRTTLSKISSRREYNTTTDVLDRLCWYFSCRLEELAEHVPDDTASASGGDVPDEGGAQESS